MKSQLRNTRRQLLLALSLLPLASFSFAQPAADAQTITATGLHSFGLRVSDVERSVAFYQGLFGSPVVARIGEKVVLQLGDGPEYFTISPVRAGDQPHISYFGLAVPGATRFQLQARLQEHGLNRTVDSMHSNQSTALNRAMHSWLERLPGDEDDTTMLADNQELFFADPNGVVVQLTSPNDCGLGDAPCTPEPAPGPGLIELIEINHMTTFVHNYQVTNDFYRKVFGFQDQAFQGTFPLLGVGEGTHFLMFVGGAQPGSPTQPGRIDHASLNIENFSVESVLQTLTDYGLTPRQEGQNGPLQHWVSMRMPDRGGASPNGTPEVYFSDPDGISIQLQHHTYCGGGNEFGGDCGQ